MKTAILFLLSCLLELSSSAFAETIQNEVIILGVNEPLFSAQSPLEFADDDAVAFARIMKNAGNRVNLLSVLDADTQKLNQDILKDARIPTKEALFQALEESFKRIQDTNKTGQTTDFYFIYSGHGGVDKNGEGFLSLSGGDKLSRTDLYDHILSKSPARFNHLIVDACDAYFFVQSRGQKNDVPKEVEERMNRAATQFMAKQTLSRFKNTGAILSTAAAREVHEWSQVRAGIFSHTVRSALSGAADANQDRKIEYEELEAFVLSALSQVRHAKAEHQIYVRPPAADLARPVLDLTRTHERELILDAQISGRIAISNLEGVPYADMHKSPGYVTRLALLPNQDFMVLLGNKDFHIPRGLQNVHVNELEAFTPTMKTRGAGIAEAYERGLFATPFGPQLVEGFALRKIQDAEPITGPIILEKERGHSAAAPLAITTGVLALLAGGTAVVTNVLSNQAYDNYQSENSTIQRNSLAQDIRTYDTITNIAIGSAAALGVTSLTLGIISLFE